MSREKQIYDRIDLSDTIDYAMRDWDDYIDECREEEIQPIGTFEEYIADYVLRAGYRKQEWISVEERLPTWQDGKVLVFTTYGFSVCERTVNGRWQGKYANWITHWMPLPEPPKGE